MINFKILGDKIIKPHERILAAAGDKYKPGQSGGITEVNAPVEVDKK